MKKLKYYFFLLLISSTGCSEKKTEASTEVALAPESSEYALDKLNYMRLKKGKFLSRTANGIPGTTRQDLSQTIEHLAKNDSHLVLYFHGGLIPAKIAFNSPKKIGLDSVIRKSNCFPFYVMYGGSPKTALWPYRESKFGEDEKTLVSETNPLDSALENLFSSRSFQYFHTQLQKQFYSQSHKSQYHPIPDTLHLRDTANSQVQFTIKSSNRPIRISKLQQENFIKSLKGDTIFQDLCRKDAGENAFISEKGKIDYAGALYNIDSTVGGISLRVNANRDHGPVMTITEEIMHNAISPSIRGLCKLARSGWHKIKKDVINPFNIPASSYGGTALLDELLLLDSLKHKKIFLIGSSTGANMICHLLQNASRQKYKNLRFNVIFSVPACTFRLLAETVTLAHGQIEKFHMFALNEEAERTAGIDALYPGTILYFVSGVCEKNTSPYHDQLITGMRRFYSPDFRRNSTLSDQDKNDIDTVVRFLGLNAERSPQVIWANEPCPDIHLSNSAERHTGVVRNPDVHKSLNYLLTH